MEAALSSFALIALISIALIFDALNGLHDAANSIATVVSTRVLPAALRRGLGRVLQLVAFLFFGLHVAQTVGTGIVAAEVVDAAVIFGALMGAIVWNLITWWLGIPSSSSHALIGGLAGAGSHQSRARSYCLERPRHYVGSYRSVSAGRLFSGSDAGARRVLGIRSVNSIGRGQFLPHRPASFGGALLARSWRQRRAEDHGHHRGIALFARPSWRDLHVPFWVVLVCQAAMGLGTLVGGWRIVHTLGSRITRLHPVQGFCAEAGGSMTLFLATYFGIPVSTTHTITGAIVGVGAARKVAGVRWNVASNVVVAWIVTLPASALFGAAFYELYKFLF